MLQAENVQADNARKLQIALKIAVKRDELQITRVEIEKSQNLQVFSNFILSVLVFENLNLGHSDSFCVPTGGNLPIF